MTDVTGVGIRNLLAGNLRKSAGIMRFGNGLPRQSVPQGHLLRSADWLAMTGFLFVGGAAMGGQVVRPYNAGHEPHKMGRRGRRPRRAVRRACAQDGVRSPRRTENEGRLSLWISQQLIIDGLR